MDPKPINETLTNMMKNMKNSGSGLGSLIDNPDIIREYDCEGCGEHVKVERMIRIAGPKKGQAFEAKHGCKCEERKMVQESLKEISGSRANRIFSEFSKIPDEIQGATLRTYTPDTPSTKEAKVFCFNFIKDFSDKPQNLLLYGNTGVGKSHLAHAIALQVKDKGHTAVFIPVTHLLTNIRDTYNRQSKYTEAQYIRVMVDVELLVLDDLGTEYIKRKGNDESWVLSKLFEIIDARSGKSTVYTTNLTMDQLLDVMEKRLFSRMMKGAVVKKLESTDKRLPEFLRGGNRK